MLRRYEGKVALVTASATGIGLGISRRLAQEGATVIISSRNKANIDSAIKELQKEGLNPDGFPCHVGKKEDREKLLEYIKTKYGRLDVLVLNAAISTHFGNLFDTTETMFDKTFDINVKAVFFMIKEYHTIMPKGSAVLLISSYEAYALDKTIGVYAVTKTAILGLTKLLAHELKEQNIRVNCIAPGLIRTKFAGSLLTHEEVIKERMGIDRVGTTEDIAGAAAFLCSKDADYVIGEIVSVAGFVSQRL